MVFALQSGFRWASWNHSVTETVLSFCFVTWKETSTKFWCENFCVKYCYVATDRQNFHLWWFCNSGCHKPTTVLLYLLSNLKMFVFNAHSIKVLILISLIFSNSFRKFFFKKNLFVCHHGLLKQLLLLSQLRAVPGFWMNQKQHQNASIF